MHQRKPRKIILLSDGTGNSSNSQNKSNVWRLYQSLDLGPDDTGFYEQIAFYDDGVGTSSVRFLWLLGSVFGLGLSRNVRQLYKELCRHYLPGDKIYIFGFSRGAFTARVLAHFIEICGILDTSKKIPLWPYSLSNKDAFHTAPLETNKGFNRAVSKAYKSYRRSYWSKRDPQKETSYLVPWIISSALRFIRNKILRSDVLNAEKFKDTFCHRPKTGMPKENVIEFMGVWDTVDAVGLPIDELADFLDKYLYPYRFKNQNLGKGVGRAAQALAIDDERQTFHPILFDQSTPKDKERISQVWFTGMHANVGGGYPEDNLSAITFGWMIDRINEVNGRGSGLHFNPAKLVDFAKLAVPTGKIYDSRKGLKSFYRYKPRNIETLTTKGAFGQAKFMATPAVIHHSVLDRIRAQNAGYAPNGIPEEFEIYENTGAIKPHHLSHPFLESFELAVKRKKLHMQAEDVMLWGKVSYYSMLACLISIFAFPFVYRSNLGLNVTHGDNGFWENVEGLMSNAVIFLSEKAATVVGPEISSYWFEAWIQNVFPLMGLVLLLLIFLCLGGYLKGVSHRFAESAWAGFKENNTHIPEPKNGFILRMTRKIREWPLANASHKFFAQRLIPFTFFVTIAGLSVLLIVRPENNALQVKVDDCIQDNLEHQTFTLKLKEKKAIVVKTNSPCIASGVWLEKGKIYEVNVEIVDK